MGEDQPIVEQGEAVYEPVELKFGDIVNFINNTDIRYIVLIPHSELQIETVKLAKDEDGNERLDGFAIGTHNIPVVKLDSWDKEKVREAMIRGMGESASEIIDGYLEEYQKMPPVMYKGKERELWS